MGLASGIARGHVLLRVIDELPRQYGGASAVAAGRDGAIVLAQGLLYARGDNGYGQLGTGYLQSAFSPPPGIGFEDPRPMPASAEAFAPVPALGSPFASIAASDESRARGQRRQSRRAALGLSSLGPRRHGPDL